MRVRGVEGATVVSDWAGTTPAGTPRLPQTWCHHDTHTCAHTLGSQARGAPASGTDSGPGACQAGGGAGDTRHCGGWLRGGRGPSLQGLLSSRAPARREMTRASRSPQRSSASKQQAQGQRAGAQGLAPQWAEVATHSRNTARGQGHSGGAPRQRGAEAQLLPLRGWGGGAPGTAEPGGCARPPAQKRGHRRCTHSSCA